MSEVWAGGTVVTTGTQGETLRFVALADDPVDFPRRVVEKLSVLVTVDASASDLLHMPSIRPVRALWPVGANLRPVDSREAPSVAREARLAAREDHRVARTWSDAAYIHGVDAFPR